MKKHYLFLISFAFLGMLGCQDNLNMPEESNEEAVAGFIVSQNEARTIAEGMLLPFEDTATKSKSKKVKSAKSINRGAKDPYFHIINFDEGGFVIVSGDKRVAPLMAYSEEGSFSFDETAYPEGLCLWMDNAVDSITGLRKRNAAQDEVTKVL